MTSIKYLQSIAAPGTIIMSLNPNPPEGYLRLEGQLLERSVYVELCAICMKQPYIWGNGTTTHFTLPDFRGRFLRGSTNTMMYYQDCAMRKITGKANIKDNYMIAGGLSGAFYNYGEYGYNAKSNNRSGAGWVLYFDASKTVRTDVEFRPRNIAVHFYIKY